MKIISPTFQGGHKYDEYDKKYSQLEEAFATSDNLCFDLDFLHFNEISKYLGSMLIPKSSREYKIRTKYMKTMKEILRVLDGRLIAHDSMSYGEEFYYINVQN